MFLNFVNQRGSEITQEMRTYTEVVQKEAIHKVIPFMLPRLQK